MATKQSAAKKGTKQAAKSNSAPRSAGSAVTLSAPDKGKLKSGTDRALAELQRLNAKETITPADVRQAWSRIKPWAGSIVAVIGVVPFLGGVAKVAGEGIKVMEKYCASL